MAKFRKKPVVVEAVQYQLGREQEIEEWSRGDVLRAAVEAVMVARTPEGPRTVSPGDWIIRGVKGEFYPCKPSDFAATYEPAPEDRHDD